MVPGPTPGGSTATVAVMHSWKAAVCGDREPDWRSASQRTTYMSTWSQTDIAVIISALVGNHVRRVRRVLETGAVLRLR